MTGPTPWARPLVELVDVAVHKVDAGIFNDLRTMEHLDRYATVVAQRLDRLGVSVLHPESLRCALVGAYVLATGVAQRGGDISRDLMTLTAALLDHMPAEVMAEVEQ